MFAQNTVVLGLATWAALPTAALAQDPVPLYPENYRAILENDRVRVLDFQLKRGWTTEITMWRRVRP